MTIHWIACGLTSVGMHCHTMAHAARSAAKRLKIDLSICAPRTVRPGIARTLDLRPVLTRSVYEANPGSAPDPASLERLLAARRDEFRHDLDRALAAAEPADTVVLVTPMAAEIAALADWSAARPPGSRPHLAAYCVLPISFGLAADAAWQRATVTQLYADNLHRLAEQTDGTFRLLCESRQVLGDLSPFLPGAALRPHIFDVPPVTEPRGRPGIPYVLFIGAQYRSRTDKGIDLVLDMLRRPEARETSFDWAIQVAPMFRQPPAGCTGANIRYILDVPDRREYWNQLAGAALVLLPYDPRAYGDGRGSGIFEEALAAGVPAVCSEAPFFVERLTALGLRDLLFSPYDAESMYRTICTVMENFDRYRSALSRSEQHRAGSIGADAALKFLTHRV